MPTSTLTSKGQVTVPKKIRDRLGLKEGDKLEFKVEERERLVVRPRRTNDKVLGALRDFAPDEPVTVEEMNKAVRRRAAAKDRETRS